MNSGEGGVDDSGVKWRAQVAMCGERYFPVSNEG